MTLSPYPSGPVSHLDCEHASSSPSAPSEDSACQCLLLGQSAQALDVELVSIALRVCTSTVIHLKNSCLPWLTVCPIGIASQAPPEK